MLLASMAYGQSNRVNLKWTNEIGLNFNIWHQVHQQQLFEPPNFEFYSASYGRWVSDKLVLGTNFGYSDAGHAGTFLTSSLFAKHYFISETRLGVYGKAEAGLARTNKRPISDPDALKSVKLNYFGQVGLGAEYRFTPKLSAFGEANYMQMITPEKKSGGFMSFILGLRFRF